MEASVERVNILFHSGKTKALTPILLDPALYSSLFQPSHEILKQKNSLGQGQMLLGFAVVNMQWLQWCKLNYSRLTTGYPRVKNSPQLLSGNN